LAAAACLAPAASASEKARACSAEQAQLQVCVSHLLICTACVYSARLICTSACTQLDYNQY
jgi:hypothetical protein